MILGYTINGAKQLGIEDTKGSVEVGKDADYIVFDTVAILEPSPLIFILKYGIMGTYMKMFSWIVGYGLSIQKLTEKLQPDVECWVEPATTMFVGEKVEKSLTV